MYITKVLFFSNFIGITIGSCLSGPLTGTMVQAFSTLNPYKAVPKVWFLCILASAATWSGLPPVPTLCSLMDAVVRSFPPPVLDLVLDSRYKGNNLNFCFYFGEVHLCMAIKM